MAITTVVAMIIIPLISICITLNIVFNINGFVIGIIIYCFNMAMYVTSEDDHD